MERTDIPYSAKEIVARLDIGDSTLRKWCLALEEQNYNFIRTDQNKRMFTEKDSYVLTQFKHLVKDKNMSINNAAVIVAAKYEKEVFSNETEIEQVGESLFLNETEEELKAEIEQLREMNRQLLTRLDEQQKYIENRFDQQEALLKESIQQSQETKQLLLETTAREQQSEQQKKPRKGLLRLFSKD
ncbi:MerR family transcriptional regulator [Bacillus sp. JJ1122]|uniref:MerR family transcriptional regulator n=1 Tax=Bacillus sp. JJ1122 TaxID=3122951 RepID=UPI0030000D60